MGDIATNAEGDAASICRYTFIDGARPYLTATELRAETSHEGGRIYYNVPGVAVVKWDAPSQSAHIEWQGWARPAEFRSANDALVEAIKAHRGSRLLGDTSKIKAIQQSDQDWVNGDWFPRVLAAGATRMALVIPASGLAKMNIDDMVSRVADQLDVAYFATIDEARSWLAKPIPSRPQDSGG